MPLPRPDAKAFASPVLAPKQAYDGRSQQPPPTPQRATPSSDRVQAYETLYKAPENSALGQCALADFHCVGILGEGSSGLVSHVVHKASRVHYALKRSRRLLRGVSERNAALQEVATRSRIPSARLVRVHTAWQEGGTLCMLMELCLTDLTRVATAVARSEALLWQLLRDALLCLADVHSAGFVHNDVKPDNLYLSEGGVRLGDFGLMCSAGAAPTSEGDARYLPPEALAHRMRAHPASDIFALGMAFFEIASCVDLPPNGDDWHALRQGRAVQLPGHLSDALAEALTVMLQPAIEARPSAVELLRNERFAALPPTAAADLRRLADAAALPRRGAAAGLESAARETARFAAGSPDVFELGVPAAGAPRRLSFDLDMDDVDAEVAGAGGGGSAAGLPPALPPPLVLPPTPHAAGSTDDPEVMGLTTDEVLAPIDLGSRLTVAAGSKRPRALFSPGGALSSPRHGDASPSPTLSMLLSGRFQPQPPVVSPRAFGLSPSPQPQPSPSPSPRPPSRTANTPQTPPRNAMAAAAAATPATPVRLHAVASPMRALSGVGTPPPIRPVLDIGMDEVASPVALPGLRL